LEEGCEEEGLYGYSLSKNTLQKPCGVSLLKEAKVVQILDAALCQRDLPQVAFGKSYRSRNREIGFAFTKTMSLYPPCRSPLAKAKSTLLSATSSDTERGRFPVSPCRMSGLPTISREIGGGGGQERTTGGLLRGSERESSLGASSGRNLASTSPTSPREGQRRSF
jgi:hypothetical protein